MNINQWKNKTAMGYNGKREIVWWAFKLLDCLFFS